MRRLFYTLLIWLLQPWVLLHLLLRSRRQPEYRAHVAERYGFYPALTDSRPCIWIHAVSVGETRATEPLIKVLQEKYPGYRILLTHMTPTGRATCSALLEDCERRYLAYDLPGAVRRFLRHYQPVVGLLMETELWPNLIAACKTQGVPLLLANARLSEKSFHAYRRFGGLTRTALQQLHAVLAQSTADAERLRALGAQNVEVVGNLKFDITPDSTSLGEGKAWRMHIGRPVVLAASTREGEETLLLKAWQAYRPDALLVIVPRHPQRFDIVAAEIAATGLPMQRRSGGLPDPGCAVWLGDSMGEMATYYAAADIAIMGGSLLDYGSQNLIEACAAGTPVILGPSIFNFAEAAAHALAGNAAVQVADAIQAVRAATELLADPARLQAMSVNAAAFSAAHQGASKRLLTSLEGLLPPAAALLSKQ